MNKINSKFYDSTIKTSKDIFNVKVPNYMIKIEDEYWIDIGNFIVPGINPYYKISSWGRVYSYNRNIIMQQRINNSGYLMITLSTIHGPMDILVHRLVLSAFAPILNSKLYQANHRDGNRLNNNILNLEWCDYSYNNYYIRLLDNTPKQFTIFDNMIPNGSNNKFSIIDRSLVPMICEQLELGTPYKDICKIIGIDDNEQNITCIGGIFRRTNFKDISCNYNFPDVYRYGDMFDKNTLTNIFICIAQGKNNREIINELGLDESKKCINKLSEIRRGESYRELSKDYFSPKLSLIILSNDQVHFICKSLESGDDINDIVINLGFNINDVDICRKVKNKIKDIKNKVYYKNISCNYNF